MNYRVDTTDAVVFVSGVVSMSLEILAGRILAPEFGSTIYTWGGLIGVFLTALSLGYLLGGRYAGRATPLRLYYLLIVAAVLTALVDTLRDPINGFAAGLAMPTRYASLVPTTLLFAPVTLLLGIISPFTAQLSQEETKGGASGRVYALGTIGSIAGTFVTTFALIPNYSTGTVLVLLAALTALTAAVLAAVRLPVAHAVVAAAIAIAVAAPTLAATETEQLYQTQTPYQRLTINQTEGYRALYLNGVPNGAMWLDNRSLHVFDYTRYFDLAFLYSQDVERALFVGAGTYTGPKAYLTRSGVHVDVVEIDPGVVDAANRYFRVPNTTRLQTHVEDGRRYLQGNNVTYDVIVLDAYRSLDIPFHLTTQEFFTLVDERLDDDGVVISNVLARREGERSEFYRAEYATLQSVFPTVDVYGLEPPRELQNTIFVATKNATRYTPDQLRARNKRGVADVNLSRELDHLIQDPPAGQILRDDMAPVNMLAVS